MVNYKVKEKSLVSVQALRSLWDQKHGDHESGAGNQERGQQQSNSPTAPPPALPPKSKTRKLTGTVSVDAMSPSPPVTLELTVQCNDQLVYIAAPL